MYSTSLGKVQVNMSMTEPYLQHLAEQQTAARPSQLHPSYVLA